MVAACWYAETMDRTILIVDDEPRILQIARDYLERAGFRVRSADDGPTALRMAREERPNLIVLDVMLPGIDGLDVMRSLKRDAALSEVPIIMLTARVEEADKLVGLELGADDYLTKPFSPRELVARTRAVLRRTEGKESSATLQRFGDLAIDLEKRSVVLAGQPIELTATEFDLLQVLAGAPGRPFTRAQLLERVYDESYIGYDRTVDAHIKNLRRKLEPNPDGQRFIVTIYGVGYKFAEQ